MSNYASRLDRLEDAIRPMSPEPLNILCTVVDPDAPGDMVVSVIAVGDDRSRVEFVREPNETTSALCERAERAMGWKR